MIPTFLPTSSRRIPIGPGWSIGPMTIFQLPLVAMGQLNDTISSHAFMMVLQDLSGPSQACTECQGLFTAAQGNAKEYALKFFKPFSWRREDGERTKVSEPIWGSLQLPHFPSRHPNWKQQPTLGLSWTWLSLGRHYNRFRTSEEPY